MDIDMVDLCQRLDITVESGSNKENGRHVLCPYHVGYNAKPSVEHDFGSASIYIKGNFKGIHCFVCGKSYSAPQLVMDRFSINYREAMNFINGENAWENTDKNKYAAKKLFGVSKSFGGTTSEEVSETVLYAKHKKKAYKTINGFINDDAVIVSAENPEYVIFNEGLDFSDTPSYIQTKVLTNLLKVLEEEVKEAPTSKKDFMERREKLKKIKEIKKAVK